VSYGDAENIMSLRAGLYDRIEELKLGFRLIEAGVAFAGDVAALGGIASMLGHPGGLFEPVPRKKTETRTAEPPVPSTRTKTDPKTPPKRTVIRKGEETQSTVVTRTEEDPTGFKGEKKRPPAQQIGKEPTEEPSPKVGGKKRHEPEDPKGGKMTETLAEPALSAKAVDHVFQGDEFGGYHSTARGANPNVKVLKVRQAPDTNGVYKVKLEIRDPTTGKVVTKDSTMFPDHWSEQKILDETYAVMRANPPGAPNSKGVSVAEGISPSGVVIRIDYRNGVPDSFYPVHTKDQR